MKYTNKHNLPEEVVLWLKTDDYDYEEGVMSATMLMKPVRAIVLIKRYFDQIEKDVSDLIAQRYGTAIHDSFEKVKLPGTIQEVRYHAELNGQKLSGKPDILEKVGDKILRLKDIKSTSVWTHIYGSRDEDHKIQLSIYAWLLRQNGYTLLVEADIIYAFTDWKRSDARKRDNYPDTRIIQKTIPLMSPEDTETYILHRLMLINKANPLPDDDLPACTKEELWAKDDTWAVMKKGRKSAVKVFDDEREAEKFYLRLRGTAGHSIEHRPGNVNRCNYCDASAFCNQFKAMAEQGIIAE